MPVVVGDAATTAVAAASAPTAFPLGTRVFSPKKKEKQPQQEETNEDEEQEGATASTISTAPRQEPQLIHNSLIHRRGLLVTTPQERDILIVETEVNKRGSTDGVHHHHQHHSPPPTPHQHQHHHQQQNQHIGTLRYQQFLDMIVRNTSSDRDDQHPQAIHNILETIYTNGGRFIQPYHYNNYTYYNNKNNDDDDKDNNNINDGDQDNREGKVEVVVGMDKNNNNNNNIDRGVAAPQWCTMVDRNRIKRYILHSLQQSRRNFISTTTNNNNTTDTTTINRCGSDSNSNRDSSSTPAAHNSGSTRVNAATKKKDNDDQQQQQQQIRRKFISTTNTNTTITTTSIKNSDRNRDSSSTPAAAAKKEPSPPLLSSSVSSAKSPPPPCTLTTIVDATSPTERSRRHGHVLTTLHNDNANDKKQRVIDVDVDVEVEAAEESGAEPEQKGCPQDQERKKTCTSNAKQKEDQHNETTVVQTAAAATAEVVRLGTTTTAAVKDSDNTCTDDADSIRSRNYAHKSGTTLDTIKKNNNEDQQQPQTPPAQQSSSRVGIDSTPPPPPTTTILNDFSKDTGVCGDDDEGDNENENDTMMSDNSEGKDNEDVRTNTTNSNNSSQQEKNKSALAVLALVSASATTLEDDDDNDKTLSEDSSYPVLKAVTAVTEDTTTTWEPYTMSTSTCTFTRPSSHHHRDGDPPQNSKDKQVHDDDDDDEQDDRVGGGDGDGEGGEEEEEDVRTTKTVIVDDERVINRMINKNYTTKSSSLSSLINEASLEIDKSVPKKKKGSQLPLAVEEGSTSTGITTKRTTGSSRSEKKKIRTGKKRNTTKDRNRILPSTSTLSSTTTTKPRRQNNNCSITKRKKTSSSDNDNDDEPVKKKKKRSVRQSASSLSLVSKAVSLPDTAAAAAEVEVDNDNEGLVSATESLEASTDTDTDSEALQEFGCICRLPHNNDTHGQLFWIECGGCRSWWEVHPNCIGFTRKKAETINWNCSLCEPPATAKGDDNGNDDGIDEPVKKKRRSALYSGSAVAVASSSTRSIVRSNTTTIDSDYNDNDDGNDDDVSDDDDDDDDDDELWTEENRCSLLPKNNNTNTPTPAAAITTKKHKSTYTMSVHTYKTRQDRWTRTWNTFFQQLVAYKAQFHTTLVPKKHKQDPYWHLGGWVTRQRTRYKENLLPTDRIDRLESIGFLWDASFQAMTGRPGTLYTQTQNDMWQNMFQQYTVYQEKYHTNTVFPSKGKRETQLLLWVKSQRGYKKNGKISQHRIDLLDGIGFVWSLRDVQWMDMYQQLVAYHKQHKSASVPIRCTQHPQLAKWVGLQRQCYKKKELSVARIKYLEALGFVWTFFDLVPWNEMYDRLVAYQQRHKSTLVPHNYPTDPRLSNWVKKQRQNYHKDKLSDSQIASLTALDFVWKAKEVDMLPWSAMYDRLVAFTHRHHGSTLVPSEYIHDLRLGHWVRKQRYKYKTGILLEKRMDLLNDIDFVWFVHKN